MKNKKQIIVIILILATAAVSFLLPKSKYRSPDILSKLTIPPAFSYWRSQDVSASFNPNDLRYNFISRVFAREYANKYRQRLVFLILDAGNFHNPKVCYGSSGYSSRDLPNPQFTVANRTFKAQAVYFEKPGESQVIIYWICINKKIVDWMGQKWLEFLYAVLNKEKTGLMVRIDIPCTAQTIDSAIKTGQEFISQLASQLPSDQQAYLFGE